MEKWLARLMSRQVTRGEAERDDGVPSSTDAKPHADDAPTTTSPLAGPVHVIVYTKQGCGWCYEVLDLLDSRGIGYEEREVYSNRQYFDEMVEKSGQWLAPVVEIDGHLLIDTDAYEVERHLSQLADKSPAS
ncbi:MAG: hypothetical protein CL878_08470 [Dehalococcoidia bacterium]|nr:hypothetical protein [Dehalococcoidia bacterium]